MCIRLFGVILLALFDASPVSALVTCVNGVFDITNRSLPAIPGYDPDTCGIDGPQAVYGSGNNFSVMPPLSFADFRNVQLVNLSFSKMTRIEDGAFLGAIALTDLDTSGNPLGPALFGKPFRGTSLKILSMRQCSLFLMAAGVFDASFSRLQQLDLSQNSWIYISKMLLGNLTGLEKLNLSYNTIESIHHEAFAMNLELKFIHLGNNQLELISKSLFVGLPNLKRLVLEGNSDLKGPIFVPAGVVVDPSYLLDMGTTTAAPPQQLVPGDRLITTDPPEVITGSSSNASTVIAVIGAIVIIVIIAFVVVVKIRNIRRQQDHVAPV